MVTTPNQRRLTHTFDTTRHRSANLSIAGLELESEHQKQHPRSRKVSSAGHPVSRTPHRVVERRYRHNLNAQIELLASKLPRPTGEFDSLDLYPRVTSKPTIMTNTISHIKVLEDDKMKSDAFVRKLQGQIIGLQKLLLHDQSLSGLSCY